MDMLGHVFCRFPFLGEWSRFAAIFHCGFYISRRDSGTPQFLVVYVLQWLERFDDCMDVKSIQIAWFSGDLFGNPFHHSIYIIIGRICSPQTIYIWYAHINVYIYIYFHQWFDGHSSTSWWFSLRPRSKGFPIPCTGFDVAGDECGKGCLGPPGALGALAALGWTHEYVCLKDHSLPSGKYGGTPIAGWFISWKIHL